MPPTKDEERLREKVKTLSIVLLLGTVVFISIFIVILPVIMPEYRVPEGALIAVLAALTTSALGLAGVSTRIGRG